MTLAAENISFAYHPGRPILRGVSVALRPGAVTAIIGPNGAGKSTLLRLLAGLLVPEAGRVLLQGRPIGGLGHRERSRLVGYIPQRPSLSFAFTVREVVGMGRYAAARRDAATADALALVGLSGRADEPFPDLSAGQQQRAALARGLAQLDLDRPGTSGAVALLADEPVSAMDPRHALATMELLRDAASRGLAVGVVLHDLTLAARYADDAVLMSERGVVQAHGAAADILTPAVLESGFGVSFQRFQDGPVVAIVPSARVESGR